MKNFVRACHALGMEVLFGVDMKHMIDSGNNALTPAVSLRGIDNQLYFRGDVLNVNHPVVSKLVLDALYHLNDTYDLDGFFIQHAETMAVNSEGHVVDAAPLLEEICYSPRLGRTLRLVAHMGNPDSLPRNGQRGLSHWGRLSEVSPRVTEDWWGFLSGIAPNPSNLATRLSGSPDLFADAWGDEGLPGCLAAGRRASFSWTRLLPRGVNSIGDLIRAGAPAALVVSLVASSMLAPGVPLLPLGLDRALPPELAEALPQLVPVLAAFRVRNKVCIQPDERVRKISWHGADGTSEPSWGNDAPGSFVGLRIEPPNNSGMPNNSGIYMGFNSSNNVSGIAVAVPPPPHDMMWHLVALTSAPGPGPPNPPGTYLVGPHGVMVLEAVPAHLAKKSSADRTNPLDNIPKGQAPGASPNATPRPPKSR